MGLSDPALLLKGTASSLCDPDTADDPDRSPGELARLIGRAMGQDVLLAADDGEGEPVELAGPSDEANMTLAAVQDRVQDVPTRGLTQ